MAISLLEILHFQAIYAILNGSKGCSYTMSSSYVFLSAHRQNRRSRRINSQVVEQVQKEQVQKEQVQKEQVQKEPPWLRKNTQYSIMLLTHMFGLF